MSKLAYLFLCLPLCATADVVVQSEPERQFDSTNLSPLTPPALPALQVATNDDLSISPEALLQKPELLSQALYSAVMQQQLSAVKVLLPLYQQLSENHRTGHHHALLYTLAQAQIARHDGDTQQAITLYRKALSLDPNILAGQFALAQSLFDNNQRKDARAIFLHLDTQALPNEVKHSIKQYLNTIDLRERWGFWAGATYTKDTNINNTPRYQEVAMNGGTWTLPKQESATGISYQFGTQKDWSMDGSWHLKADLSASGKRYWDNSKYDDLTLRAMSGISHQSTKTQLAVLPYVERRFYGNQGYSWEAGLRGEWSNQLPKGQLQFAGEFGKENYDNRTHLNGHRTNLSVSWLLQSSPKQYWVFGTDFTEKTAKDDSDAYTRHAIRLNFNHQWGQTATSITTSVGMRQYQAPDLLNIKRADKEYQISVSLWDNRLRFWGMTPRLVTTWQKHDSNHPFYKYDKTNAYIQLNKRF